MRKIAFDVEATLAGTVWARDKDEAEKIFLSLIAEADVQDAIVYESDFSDKEARFFGMNCAPEPAEPGP